MPTALRKWHSLIRMIPYAMIIEFLFQVRTFNRFVMLTGQRLAAVRGALLQTFRLIQPYGMYTVHPKKKHGTCGNETYLNTARVNTCEYIPLGMSFQESDNPGCQFPLGSLEIFLCSFAWIHVLHKGHLVLIL